MKLLVSFIICLLTVHTVSAQLLIDAALKKRLDDIHERDQRYRGILSDFSSVNVKQLDSLAIALNCDRRKIRNCIWDLQLQLDSTNLVWVEKIIKEKGYPGKTLVGTPANEAAWWVIQHSPEIKKYYPLIEKAGRQGELPMHLVAKMEDRLLTEDNKPQKYGTQAIELAIADQSNGTVQRRMYLWPVADAANVNARRREAGFEETVQENAKRLNAIFDKNLTMEKMAQLQVLPEQPMLLPPEIRTKIKKAKELVFPARDIDTSAFIYYQQAGNYSKAGDTVNAANALQKVSPYYLLYTSPSPTHFEGLLKKFTLTADAKDKLRQKYQTAYNSTKAPSYDSFKHFYINIQYLRSALHRDTKQNRDSAERKLKFYDSVGMKYLRSYVARHGWPSLAEGSMYALYIALRDIEYYYDYLLAMESAFYKGDVSLQMAEGIKENRHFYSDYMLVRHSFKRKHLKLPMNMLLYGQMPSRSFQDSIGGILQQMCPLKELYYILYINKDQLELKEKGWVFKYGDDFEQRVLRFQSDLEGDCPLLEHSVVVRTRIMLSDKKDEELYLLAY